MPTWNGPLAVATAAAIFASVTAAAQAQIRDSTVTGAEVYIPGDPFKCGTDEGYDRRISCERRVL